MSYDASTQTVNLKLIAHMTSDNGGFNSNGDSKGALDISVPKGWTVNVTLTNEGALPRSAVVLASGTDPIPR